MNRFNIISLDTRLYSKSDCALIIASIINTSLILALILKYSNYGFDFTDESFYLVWMATPFLYDWSHTQFGYFFHPIYLMLDGNITTLRQVNIFLIFTLSWCLVVVLLQELAPKASAKRFSIHIISAGVATVSLIFFGRWLLTPSYNSLAFQALLLFFIGLVFIRKSSQLKIIIGWGIIGASGWLAFMAKPTTAFALSIGCSAFLLIGRKYSLVFIFFSITLALFLLMISAILIDGSIYLFVERLRISVEMLGNLDAGHNAKNILRLDTFDLSPRDIMSMWMLLFGCLFASFFRYSDKRIKRLLAALTNILLFITVILATLGFFPKFIVLGKYQGLVIWSVIIAMALFNLIHSPAKGTCKTKNAQWGIMILLFLTPHIYALGSNNNYWNAGGKVAIFWLLGGFVVLAPIARLRRDWSFVLPFVLGAQALTAIALHTGLERPYRQPQSIRLNDTLVEVGATGSKLMLSTDYAKYLIEAKGAARDAGFKPTMPIIDLTGQSPGILYALMAINIGQVWTVGGYPGSSKLAIASLNLVSCEKIAESWVLFEVDGPRNISNEVMVSQGILFPSSHKQVGSWKTAKGSGGYSKRRVQILYAPMSQEKSLSNCQKSRKNLTN